MKEDISNWLQDGVFKIIASAEPPTHAHDWDEERRERIIRETWSEMRTLLQVEGYAVLRAMEQSLAQHIKDLDSQKSIWEQRKNYWHLFAQYASGQDPDQPVGPERTLQLPNRLMERHRIDSDALRFDGDYTPERGETWGQATERMCKRLQPVSRQYNRFRRTVELLMFRQAMIVNVLYQHEAFGTAGELTENDIDALLKDGRLSADDLLETLRRVIKEIETQDDATAFVRDICGAVAEGLYMTPQGVRDRVVNNILPALREAYPDLHFPTGVSLRQWRACRDDLRQAIERW